MEKSNEVTLGESKEIPEIPIHAFLIESPIGNVLFDTGCNPDGMKGEWPGALRGNPYVPPKGDFDVLEAEQYICEKKSWAVKRLHHGFFVRTAYNQIAQ